MVQEVKAIPRRIYTEFYNKKDPHVVRESFTPDFVAHLPGGDIRGPDGFEREGARLHAAFPDLYVTVEDVIAEGDMVAMRWTAQGIHKGEYMGAAPTGKHVTVTGIDLFRLADRKIAEQWSVYDALGLLQQIGAMPARPRSEQV